jgi:hypothetical protein
LDIATKVREARKLRDEKHYSSAVDVYGKVLEGLFEVLYKEYFPNLTDAETEKVLDYRKKTGKQIDRFTIGEWIGLFRVSNLYDIIEKSKKKPDEGAFVFFTLEIVGKVNELRNRNTHAEKDLICYDQQHVASFIESCILCMLQELRLFPEVELVNRRFSRQKVNPKKTYEGLSREDVLSASKDPAINDFKFTDKFVEIDGTKYPIRGLISLASGVSTSNLSTDNAANILCGLGFQVKEVQAQAPLKQEIDISANSLIQMPYNTKEEGLLHMTISKLYEGFDDLVADTKKKYSKVDGIEALTPDLARQIIKNSWRNNHKILLQFKNDAFRFYLEGLLHETLE